MNCPIVFKKATLEDEGEYLRLSKLFYATDAVLSPLPEEFHKNIFKDIMPILCIFRGLSLLFCRRNRRIRDWSASGFPQKPAGWNAGWKTCSFCRNSGEKESAEHFWTL